MAEQEIGAVYMLGVDRRHHEGCGPGAGRGIIFGDQPARLVRSFEPRRQRKARLEQQLERRFLRDGLEGFGQAGRSEEHTSELQSLMRISYAVFCLKKKNNIKENRQYIHPISIL